ncbi:GNAT family N-acetyltransferase [Methylobacterium sp. J-030]|uniref:GNAT family N-acetyltransferase n=1 Tax=Methylobacterium sp. J-030 TaxID=2836627 RepID=UPI001FB9BB92|nr:GNAT family N-acetyltransferase [Methylobacterium sp. J-030]MCJ2068925.1 GNAT family N-acetyltransferase [Methylobacterium sp. J-030]
MVRDAQAVDMGDVLRMYTPYVLKGLATFEEVQPTPDEMLARRVAVLSAGLPYLIATRGDAIVGYTYATAYRPRPAYRHTIENSVYVAYNLRGQGVGSALLGALIAECEKGSARQMVAVIGDSANAGSIALHHRFGFEMVGTLREVGFKLGRWVDTVLMQRALHPGHGSRPEQPRRGPQAVCP